MQKQIFSEKVCLSIETIMRLHAIVEKIHNFVSKVLQIRQVPGFLRNCPGLSSTGFLLASTNPTIHFFPLIIIIKSEVKNTVSKTLSKLFSRAKLP